MANVRTLEKNNKGFCLDSDFKDLEITHRNQELLRKIHSPNMDDKTLRKKQKNKNKTSACKTQIRRSTHQIFLRYKAEDYAINCTQFVFCINHVKHSQDPLEEQNLLFFYQEKKMNETT